MSDHFMCGMRAAHVDWYWESHGFEMHFQRELALCQKLVAEGKARPYHRGFLAYAEAVCR